MTPADQPAPFDVPDELDVSTQVPEDRQGDAEEDDEEEAPALVGPQTITLHEPLNLKGGRVVSEIKLQELRARHLRNMPLRVERMTFGDLLDIGGKLSGEPQKVIDNLCPEDTKQVVDIVSAFIARFQ